MSVFYLLYIRAYTVINKSLLHKNTVTNAFPMHSSYTVTSNMQYLHINSE